MISPSQNGSAVHGPLVSERWVLAACIVASSMAFIDSTALNVALPALQREFRCSAGDLLWIVNGYGIPLAALLLIGGAIADRVGRKKALIIGIGSFTTASVACGLAPNSHLLIAARVIQGIGAAVMIPSSLALLSASVPANRRGHTIGIWTACSVAMTAVGPVLGGVLAGADLWRFVFFINVPLGAAALVILYQQVSEPAATDWSNALQHPRVAGGLDLPGGLGALTCLAGLNYGLLEAAQRGFNHPIVISSLAVGMAGLIAFVISVICSPHPLIPLALFHNLTFWGVCLLTVSFYSGAYGMMFFLSLNLIQVRGYSEAATGLAQLPLMVLVIVVSPFVGRHVDRFGIRGPLLVGPFIAGIALLGLAIPGPVGGPPAYWTQFLPSLSVLGIAMGITLSPLSTAIMNSIPTGLEGIASGINSTLSRLSSVLGIAVLGPIALAVFQASLMRNTEALGLDTPTRSQLLSEGWKLAAARPPSGLSANLHSGIEQAIRQAFITAFRTVAIVSAGAVWLAAIVASTMLGFNTVSPPMGLSHRRRSQVGA